MATEQQPHHSKTTKTSSLETDFLRLQGNHHAGKGELEQALALYTKALRICLARSPPCDAKELAKLYSNRSYAYYRQRDFENAIEDAESCIRQHPTWNKGHLRKGLALFANHEFDRAKECYETGLTMCPNDAELVQALKDSQRSLTGVRFTQGGSGEKGVVQKKAETECVRVKWDEGNLQGHMEDKGKLYGTMAIDEVDTPFLVYDEELAEKHNMIGTVEKDRSVTPIDMTVLKQKLGLLSTGIDTTAGGHREQAASFEEKRLKFYQEEAKQYTAAEVEQNSKQPETVRSSPEN